MEIELVKNEKHVDFKYGEHEIKFSNIYDSWGFWDDIEQAANRAKFQLKKENPKQSFNFDIRSMGVSDEEKRQRFISHLKNKHQNVNIELLFDIIDAQVNEIKLTGPDDNHPNPFFKFELSSDLIKNITVNVVEQYEQQNKK